MHASVEPVRRAVQQSDAVEGIGDNFDGSDARPFGELNAWSARTRFLDISAYYDRRTNIKTPTMMSISGHH